MEENTPQAPVPDWVLDLKTAQKNKPQPRPSSPSLSGALYARPNPDGTRKKCENCFMWVKGKDRCLIHGPDRMVDDDDVCGYHVFGTPRASMSKNLGIKPMTPEESGLVEAGDGTSCDLCVHFRKGLCMVLAEEEGGRPGVKVDPKGCCARWAPKAGLDPEMGEPK